MALLKYYFPKLYTPFHSFCYGTTPLTSVTPHTTITTPLPVQPSIYHNHHTTNITTPLPVHHSPHQQQHPYPYTTHHNHYHHYTPTRNTPPPPTCAPNTTQPPQSLHYTKRNVLRKGRGTPRSILSSDKGANVLVCYHQKPGIGSPRLLLGSARNFYSRRFRFINLLQTT